MALMCVVRVAASVAVVALLVTGKITRAMASNEPTNEGQLDYDDGSLTGYLNGHTSEYYSDTPDALELADIEAIEQYIEQFPFAIPLQEYDPVFEINQNILLPSSAIFNLRLRIYGRHCSFGASDATDVVDLLIALHMNLLPRLLSVVRNGYRRVIVIFRHISLEYYDVSIGHHHRNGELLEVDASRGEHVKFPDTETRVSPSTVNFSTVESEKLLLELHRRIDREGRRPDIQKTEYCNIIMTMLVSNPIPTDGYYTDKLGPKSYLMSANGKFRLTMRGDCNLVLYYQPDETQLWESKTTNKEERCYAYLQPNGVLTVLDKDHNILFSSHEANCSYGESCWSNFLLVVTDSGNAVLYQISPVTKIWDALSNP